MLNRETYKANLIPTVCQSLLIIPILTNNCKLQWFLSGKRNKSLSLSTVSHHKHMEEGPEWIESVFIPVSPQPRAPRGPWGRLQARLGAKKDARLSIDRESEVNLCWIHRRGGVKPHHQYPPPPPHPTHTKLYILKSWLIFFACTILIILLFIYLVTVCTKKKVLLKQQLYWFHWGKCCCHLADNQWSHVCSRQFKANRIYQVLTSSLWCCSSRTWCYAAGWRSISC